MEHLFDARRLLRAVVAAGLAFVVLGGGIGFAVAAEEDEIPLPQRFGVAEPAVGDEVVYRYDNGTASSQAAFAWTHIATVLDRLGEPRLGVHMGHPGFRLIDEDQPLDAGGAWFDRSGRPIAYGGQFLHAFDHVYTSPLHPVITSETMEGFDGRANWFFDGPAAPCLNIHGLQGADVALDAATDAFADCSIPDTGLPWHGVLRAVAVEETSFGPALRLSGADETERIDVWFAPAVPYPVKLRLSGDADREYVLESFERGAQAFPAMDRSAGRPIRFVAPEPWGYSLPDHPFPPEDAYALALADPTWTVLSEWVARHPDHAAVRGEYYVQDRLEGAVEVWQFRLHADGAEFDLDVERVHWGSMARGELDADAPLHSHRFDGGSDSRPFYDAPALVPDIGDVAAKADRFRLVNTTPPVSEWRLFDCPDDPCPGPIAAFEFRHEEPQDLQQEPIRPYEDAHHWVRIDVAEDGGLSSVSVNAEESRSTRRTVAGGQVTGNGAPPSTPPGQGFAPASEAAWEVPSAAGAAGVGAAAAIVGALVWLWPTIKGLPVLGLFSRVRRPQLLGHPQRQKILHAIEASPGIHFQELMRATDLSNGTAVHHVRKLVEGDLITEQAGKGYTCYFAKGKVDRTVMDAAPALRSDTARRILGAVAGQPGRSGKQLADDLGLSPATMNYHVRRLCAAGLVDAPRKQGTLQLRLTQVGRKALVLAA